MKKNVKRLTAYLLALMLMLSMCATASASYSVEVVDDGEVTTVEVISKPVDVVYDVRTGILTWRLDHPDKTTKTTGNFSLQLVYASVGKNYTYVVDTDDMDGGSYIVGSDGDVYVTTSAGSSSYDYVFASTKYSVSLTNVEPNMAGFYTYHFTLPSDLAAGEYFICVENVDGSSDKPFYKSYDTSNRFTIPSTAETAPYRIDFEANGGRITELEGVKIPYPLSDDFIIDPIWRVIGIDSKSGNAWTRTDAGGRLYSLPKAEREGYVFEGWYDSSGNKLTTSTAHGSDRNYVAKWSEITDVYTVTFDLNGLSGTAPEPQQVKAGGTVELPDFTAPDGYRFLGWCYTPDGNLSNLWNEDNPVSTDITLYAVCEVDRFSFLNTASAFGRSNYVITGKYLEALQSSLNAAEWASVSALMNSNWGGSCYGMSALYCLRWADRMDPGYFQSGAEYLFDLAAPASSQTVFNLVNYYFLQQATPWGAASYYPSQQVTGKYNADLVSALSSGSGPVLISFVFGNRYFTAAELYNHDADIKGHAIVGLSCKTNSNGSHEILVWDPNLQTVDKLTVSSDNKTLNFDAGGYTYARVCAIQPVSSCASTFDKVNIQKYLSGSTSGKASSGMYTLETTLSDFTLTAADGSKAIFKNGVPVSGSLNVGVSLIVGGSAASRYILPASSSYSISTDRDVTGEVAISAGGTYVELESKGFNALSVSGKSVSVSAASAGQQNLSVTADTLGSTWNSVTVSAADTRLTLDVGDSSVKVSSANNVSATIVGSNVYTDKSSGAKSVAVTPGGVTVSTASDSLSGAEETPVRFTDVPDGAYYADAVRWAVENGITSGTGENTFSPDAPCTRAQMVTFLWRANGSPEPKDSGNRFSDVSAGAYYYKAVLWAVENGITTGTGATTFSPDATVTRGQTVTFLHRAAGSPQASGSRFSDVDSDAYYAAAVAWAVANGITDGVSATSFAPGSPCTRAQIVTFLYRAK